MGNSGDEIYLGKFQFFERSNIFKNNKLNLALIGPFKEDKDKTKFLKLLKF